MNIEENIGKIEKQEGDFIPATTALEKLGNLQYTSRFLTKDPLLHQDGTPYFEDIRIEGDPETWYDFKIHKDDVEKFIKDWLRYKQETVPFYRDRKLEDFLPQNI